MARVQTSFVDPEAEREERELAMAELLARGQPASPQAPETLDPAPEAATAPRGPLVDTAELESLLAERDPRRTGAGENEMQMMAEYKQRPDWQNKMASVFAAIAEGNGQPGAIKRTQDAQRLAGQEYSGRLDAARELDRGARPIDAGTAQMLQLGGVSPDAARSMTRDSPGLKLAAGGMGQLAARYRQQALTAEQKSAHDANMRAMAEMRLLGQKELAGDKNSLARDLAAERNQTALAAAKIRKGGGGGGVGNPEARAMGDAALLAAHANVTPEIAAAFNRGEPVDVDEAALNRLKIGKGMLASGQLDRGKASLSTFNREGMNPDATERTVATQQGNVEKKRQVRDELIQDKRVLTAAISGWKGLSPKAQQILVQNGGLAPSQLMSALKSARLSDEEQVAASRLQRLINEDIKRLSGSAVSATEGGRQGTAIGMAAGDFNPWQSPAVLNDYLKHARGVLEGRWNSAAQAYPDLWEGMGK